MTPEPSDFTTSARRQRLALMLSAVALVAACGGGGGGGGSTPAPTPPPPPPGPPVVGAVTISGVAEFESVPNNFGTDGRLNYTAASYKPIRGATVQVLATGGAVLTTTTTATDGSYTATIPAAQPVVVRVRAEMTRTGASGGQWDYRVLNNTAGNALYVLDTLSFTPTSNAEVRNPRAASGWGGTSYTGTRAAGPFAILDVVYQTTQKVLTASPNASFPALRLFWSVNNRPVQSNDVTTGNIGTSFYRYDGTHTLFLLGEAVGANYDTDEYDTHVIAHEWGHYFQSAFSRDDSVGGSHTQGDRLDMRVAFSEGWGNAWSGMALGDPRYADSATVGSALRGFVIDVSDVPQAPRGWFSEESLQYLLWNFHADPAIAFTPIYNVMTGLSNSTALSSLHNFAYQLKLAVPARAAAIDALLAGQSTTVNDAIGTGESNNGGVTAAPVLPLYKTHTFGTTQNYCVTAQADASGDGNKLGQHVYTRVTTPSGSRTITLTSTNGSGVATDPDFFILTSAGTRIFAYSGAANTETATPTLAAGTHTIVLNDATDGYTGTRCFNLTVQ